MFKLFAVASVPLIMAVAKVMGIDLQEKEAMEFADALTIVVGAVGSAVALLIPSLKAKLKFGDEAK